MKDQIKSFLLILFFILAATNLFGWNENYSALQSHFERVVKERHNSLFSGIKTRGEWDTERARIKEGLSRMLGHDRPWPKEPPRVEITHRVERPDYILECLVLETDPGIYATADFYIPRQGKGPFPLVIYQSGHSPMGVYGNKTAFKHHGTWFAARGISVLILDTIEMGELEVTHHGVYSNAWFDWYSRGYSPLGTELFNARRAMDYLVTRPEVDSRKIGATGISGGGVTTFFLTLVDDRIKAAAPVSGVCSSVGQVEGRLAVEHCDCMYPVNSRGYLFAEMGALAAPRPFLLCNADRDGLFPMPYFTQLVEKMREVYRLYGVPEALKTAVVPGGHADSEAIRLPVYAFFLKEFLGREVKLIEHGPVDTLAREELYSFRSGAPLDEHLTRIHEVFMPSAAFTPKVMGISAREERLNSLAQELRQEVFTFFPEKEAQFEPQWEDSRVMWNREIKKVSFNSFSDLRMRGIYSLPLKGEQGKRLPAVILLQDDITLPWLGGHKWFEGYDWGDRAVLLVETLDMGSRAIDDSLRHQMKREAMIAGRSFDGMRVYEIMRSVAFLKSLPEVDPEGITVVGKGEMGINGLYAAILSRKPVKIVLQSPTASHVNGPYYLGVLTVTDIPEAVSLMAGRVKLCGTVPLEIKEALKAIEPGETFEFPGLEECLR